MNDIKGPGLANLNMPSITENKSPSKLSLEHKFSDAFRAAQGRLATGIAPASALPAFRLNPAPSAMAAKAQVRDDMALHERALALRGYRQVLLASNIANADTPGYKSVDFDIYDALKKGRKRRVSAVLSRELSCLMMPSHRWEAACLRQVPTARRNARAGTRQHG